VTRAAKPSAALSFAAATTGSALVWSTSCLETRARPTGNYGRTPRDPPLARPSRVQEDRTVITFRREAQRGDGTISEAITARALAAS
jgi:hypothetical protein